jgi:hypothetical protein
MDVKSRQVVEWLLREGQVEWTTEKPSPHMEPGAHELFISVGSRGEALPEHPRMLSWKLPQWTRRAVRSTTGTVFLCAGPLDALSRQLRETPAGDPPAPLTLRIHEHTLDVVCATLLAAWRLLHGTWPEGVEVLCDYVGEWEQGHTETVGDYECALGTVFYAAVKLWPSSTARPSREVLELMASVLESVREPGDLTRLPPARIPPSVSRRLKVDELLYRAELSRAQRVQLDIPLGDAADGPPRRVDALFLSSLQDVTVLRLLARNDTENTHYGQGFDFMALHISRSEQSRPWHSFSLSPERAGTLGDLAGALDALEGPRLLDGTPRKKGRRFERQPNDYSDPWYSDGYASPSGRATMVAGPYSGTRLSRRELWEELWSRFNVGRHVHVLRAHTVFARPFLWRGPVPDAELVSRGFQRRDLSSKGGAFHPAVVHSFLGATEEADVLHYEKPTEGHTVHVSVYPNRLVAVWVERPRHEATSLYALAQEQEVLVEGRELWDLEPLRALAPWLAPLGPERWLVYGAYRVSRGRSSMLDDSRSMQGLFHALASGTQPSLEKLPSEAAAESRRVLRDAAGETEHWLTPTGGARIEFLLEEEERAPLACDRDFFLFLLTLGQRYSAFETSRRMAEVEQRYRTSRWQSLRPARSVRSDVMLFTNSLWHTRVSEDPDLNARYLAWHSLHGLQETVKSMKDQAAELDQYKRDQFDRMVGLLVFVFLPVSLACGFFSGAQFQDMSPSVGIPGATTGWLIFLGYTAAFTVLVFGTVFLARIMNWRRR